MVRTLGSSSLSNHLHTCLFMQDNLLLSILRCCEPPNAEFAAYQSLSLQIEKPTEASYREIELEFDARRETWRICKLEVLDPVGRETSPNRGIPPFCLPQDQPQYSTSPNQGDHHWVNDKGEVTVACGESFAARAILELVPGQTFSPGITRMPLASYATFADGTSWFSSYDLTLYPQKLEQEMEAFSVERTIRDCLGGWQPLPSGKTFCYVESSREEPAREETCKLAGGHLLELLTWEDTHTFVYLMHTIAKTSTASIAIGAEVRVRESTLDWVWKHSRKEVSICSSGCLLQTSSEVSTSPVLGSSLYLDLMRAPTAEDVFMAQPPYFSLQARASPSSEAAYYVCMKEGENRAATAPTLTTSLEEETLAPLAVTKMTFKLKTGHHTQFPFKLEVQPSSNIRICKLSVAHIGANFPCLRDPRGNPQSSQNTSRLFYSSPKRKPGFSASVHFDMISNWGETELFCFRILINTKEKRENMILRKRSAEL